MSEMIEVYNYQDYQYIFECYQHSIPVIFSSLNGQYKGHLYLDDKENPRIAILCTPFDYIYVAGDAEMEGAEALIDTLLWSKHFNQYDQKEAITFCPNDKWNEMIKRIYEKHHGVMDYRFVYKLNHDLFREAYNNRKIVAEYSFEMVYKKENASMREYPVSVAKDPKGQEAGFCAGFMIGNKHAEIDIETKEEARGKGIAKENAFRLIDRLLEDGIEPDWCCWPFRKGSQKLAESIGYTLNKYVKAHIWNVDMGK